MTLGDRIALLRQGRIEQVGPPLELYRKPASRFVATFLGSPPINIWPATPGPGGALMVAGTELDPGPSENPSSVLPPRLDVGVRPEDIAIFTQAGPGRTQGQVLLTEPMGNETIVTLQGQNVRVVARAAADFPIRPGEAAFFSISAGRAQFFDGQSGLRLD